MSVLVGDEVWLRRAGLVLPAEDPGPMLLLTGLGSISRSGHLPGAEIGVPQHPGWGGGGAVGVSTLPGVADPWHAASRRAAWFFPASWSLLIN